MAGASYFQQASRRQCSRRAFLKSALAGAAAASLPHALGGMPKSENTLAPEAEFYETLSDGLVRCRLCPRACVVPPGRRGYCRVRENRAGRYYSLSYGRAVAQNIDPIEKKPFFHVFPGARAYSIATVGCNIACRFCQNWDISQAAPEDVPSAYQAPEEIAAAATAGGCRVLAYTYSEPIVFYEYMRDCAKAGKERGLASVMVSNGYIAEKPLQALLPHLTAVKIDLKAFTQDFYAKVCQGELQPVLDTLRRLREAAVWFEIVVLIVPGMNDAPDEIKRLADWTARELGCDVPLHFSRFHPAYRLRNLPPTPPETLQQCRRIALEQGCRFVYIGNLPGDAGQATICPACGKTLIRRIGYHVAENNIQKSNCRFCGARIPGIWSA